MTKSLTKREIVLFLGAGFSKEAGLPVMSDFGSKSEKDYKGLLKHVNRNDNFRNAAPMLVEAAEVFMHFREFCEQAEILSGSDPKMENLETVFCIAEAMNEADKTHITLSNQLYTINVLISKIQLWLWKVYQQCPIMNLNCDTDDIKIEAYNRFFETLNKLGIAKNLTVITTNYDLIYEYMSWKHEMPCVYHLPDTKSFNAGHGSQQYIHQNEDDSHDNTVMCKLHGSINYFQDLSKTEQDYDLFVVKDLGDERPIGESGVWKRKPAIFAVDAIWNIRKKYGETFTPAIIPPTYAKLTQQAWLRKIWNKAFLALTNAQKIIFIGYSMPLSDGFMRALIHGAISERVSNQVSQPQVYLINDDDKAHEQYNQFFGQMFKDVQPQTFGYATTNGTIEKILRE